MSSNEKIEILPSKKKVISIAIISLFILSMFSIAVPIALAKSSLTLNPNEGPSGTIVTITGSGFTSGTSYRVYFDTNGNSRWNFGEPYVTVTANATGGFTTTLTIPTVAPGTHYIRAGSTYPYTAIASASFTVRTVWDKLLEIEGMIDEIKDELYEGGFYDFVDDWFNDIEGKLWSNADSLKNETKAIEQKLGTFSGIDTVASLLYDIWGNVDTEIDTILGRLGTAPSDSTGTIWGDIDRIWTLTDNIHGWANLTEALDEIKDELTGWFGTEGKYSHTAQVIAKGDHIYLPEGSYGIIEIDPFSEMKPMTVRITIITSGMGDGEFLVFNYFVGGTVPPTASSGYSLEPNTHWTFEVSTTGFFLSATSVNGFDIYYTYVVEYEP